ncbi:ArdC-like ssDNA-binding domain-containing protein [Rhodococcus qingshengii]|uniref:ArdC-like ssDNA-binding domain-containing protein n=1 Tax=Rhodococcus qingshengii TaxID=334542 RepID=UPI0029420DC8|nr:ArdC-like ssDNA-binding domain-containing protein [Rhodococcus qingshengii]WOI85971.1 ArdC-like ssDNA-binding domain-containing protein [Rhodococcus qingshengii]
MERTTKPRYETKEARPQPEVRYAELMDEALNMEPGALTSYSRLYDYSTTNKLYLAAQGCPFEPVATFNRWRDLNRHVTKGAKAYSIIRPIQVKRKDAEPDDENGTYTRFKPVRCIFPVSMTEGEPLPEIDPATWSKERALAALAIRQVAYESFRNNSQGYSVRREFAINPVAAYPLKTTFHEIGHIELGHTAPGQHGEYRRHRGIKEFQAESTAYLCMNELGATDQFDAGESRAYIRHWLRDQTPEDVAIRGVFKAVDSIIRAGREPGELEVAS